MFPLFSMWCPYVKKIDRMSIEPDARPSNFLRLPSLVKNRMCWKKLFAPCSSGHIQESNRRTYISEIWISWIELLYVRDALPRSLHESAWVTSRSCTSKSPTGARTVSGIWISFSLFLIHVHRFYHKRTCQFCTTNQFHIFKILSLDHGSSRPCSSCDLGFPPASKIRRDVRGRCWITTTS
jgi:hypothetical protein